MAGLVRRERKGIVPAEGFGGLERWFEDWARSMPLRWPGFLPWETAQEQFIRVDEYREDGTLVIRAELPGIDPDKDVELSVSDGMLTIQAERREEENVEEKGYVRKELRSGSFTRSLPLPDGVNESDISADYRDGILTIRVPMAESTPSTKIPISKS